MKNKRLKELNILFVAFVVLMAAFKLFYAYDMYKIYIIHNSKEDFIPITAHIYNYSTDRIKDDDGYYETVYNIKYVYSVDKMAYYFKINNMRGLVETKTIYYNPSNPEEYSFYASYEQAREEFNSNNFIGNMFFVLSIVTLLIIIFVCIFAKQDIIDNRKVKYHESIPKDKNICIR
ncbi:MAG: hypothetical protein IJO70_08365 [Lachnospiraceae bacterium]|nr:hypothetical protein [Lachnospiraceae bacterium]